MAKSRLINCEFINASSFKNDISNKAKLLYLFMIVNGDDKGFVNNTRDIIDTLANNDKEFRNEIDLSLLQNDYPSALNELIDKGLIYEFKDNHRNKVHLIRHWFYHNRLVKGLWTNYGKFLKLVDISDNEYVLKKESSKEKDINQNKLNQTNINQDNISYVNNNDTEQNISEEEMNELLECLNKRGKGDNEDDTTD